MSIAAIGDSDSCPTTICRVATNALEVLIPQATTFRKAVNSVRAQAQNASNKGVYIYSFNIFPEDLEAGYAALDKEGQRRSMRLTYSDEFNFIVRYMPGRVHETVQVYFNIYMAIALAALRPPPFSSLAGCYFNGATTFQIGEKKKEADACIRPDQSDFPSIVLEVGNSESLFQLTNDAKLWIEHVPAVQVVILISIDPPILPNPNLRITVQLYRARAPGRPVRSPLARHTEAYMAWEADWTNAATPMYLLLSDIFIGQVPAYYGANIQVNLDTVAWRQEIIDSQ